MKIMNANGTYDIVNDKKINLKHLIPAKSMHHSNKYYDLIERMAHAFFTLVNFKNANVKKNCHRFIRNYARITQKPKYPLNKRVLSLPGKQAQIKYLLYLCSTLHISKAMLSNYEYDYQRNNQINNLRCQLSMLEMDRSNDPEMFYDTNEHNKVLQIEYAIKHDGIVPRKKTFKHYKL